MNGIIIKGEFHELIEGNYSCEECTLRKMCSNIPGYKYLCTTILGLGSGNIHRFKFVKRGKIVTYIKR